jgi:hypothetical protein
MEDPNEISQVLEYKEVFIYKDTDLALRLNRS